MQFCIISTIIFNVNPSVQAQDMSSTESSYLLHVARCHQALGFYFSLTRLPFGYSYYVAISHGINLQSQRDILQLDEFIALLFISQRLYANIHSSHYYVIQQNGRLLARLKSTGGYK